MFEKGIDRRNVLETFCQNTERKVRGEDREDADVDVLIITKDDPFKMQRLISEIVVDILLKTGVYISAKVLSSSEFDFLRRINSSFYRNVSREGITVG